MPGAQSNIGIEQRLDVCIFEGETQEIEGHSRTVFTALYQKSRRL